jgi:hypothetical protein
MVRIYFCSARAVHGGYVVASAMAYQFTKRLGVSMTATLVHVDDQDAFEPLQPFAVRSYDDWYSST